MQSSSEPRVPMFRDMHEFELEAVVAMLEGFQEEHPFLQSMVVVPILAFLKEVGWAWTWT
jgi:hypothetical protein